MTLASYLYTYIVFIILVQLSLNCLIILVCFIPHSVSVRWSFLCSLFCFLGMVAGRMLIEFDLLKSNNKDCDGKGRNERGLLVVCSIGALATHLLSYVNQNLWCWKSLIGMTVHLGKVCTSQYKAHVLVLCIMHC